MKIDKETIVESIEKYGIEKQTVVCMEELAELIQELSKILRGKKNQENLIEELADVYICLETIKQINIVDDNKLQCEIYRKQERQRKRLMEVEE